MTDAVPADAILAARFARIRPSVNADADLRRRGVWLTADIQVGIGSVPVHISIVSGEITNLDTHRRLMRSWRFAINGTAKGWAEFWRPIPAPGWHDLFALSKRGELRMEGDLQALVANLQYIKDLVATPRYLADH
jgi:hypothetical protein